MSIRLLISEDHLNSGVTQSRVDFFVSDAFVGSYEIYRETGGVRNGGASFNLAALGTHMQSVGNVIKALDIYFDSHLAVKLPDYLHGIFKNIVIEYWETTGHDFVLTR